jgi:hypothetical protein
LLHGVMVTRRALGRFQESGPCVMGVEYAP